MVFRRRFAFARHVSFGRIRRPTTAEAAAAWSMATSIACGMAAAGTESQPDDSETSPRRTPPPAPSGRSESGSPAEPPVVFAPYDGGAPVTGNVGVNGGTLSRILFAVIGDTRPATVDDTAGYPAEILSTIFSGIRALEPQPPMVVSTGDYMFASISSGPEVNQAAPQLDIYMQARARFPGVFFPAMGNHECTGATTSNCGPSAKNGEPPTYQAFVDRMLRPIGKAAPYYSIDLAAMDRKWTAKFVFIAANAWSSAQEVWLESSLARPTTYTFVVRHEPASADTAPGVVPSERVMARHPYTLAIVGHSHTYRHDAGSPREVLVGNGGAPLTSKDYGFGVFSQRDDGAIEVDMIDWQSGRVDPSFHFAVAADGEAIR